MSKVILVLGGIRSGKSSYAEGIACSFGGKRVYLATANANSCGMEERVEVHRSRRGDDWQVMEEQVEIASLLRNIGAESRESTAVLVDCLTVWLGNLLHYNLDIQGKIDELLGGLKASDLGVIVLVSSEVGQGIIPENALARQFCDEIGLLNQRVAAIADEVVMVVAGIPIKIKG